ncbi:MAG: hypothetical protein DSM106950_09680 [Stigonema ocellatum SAG 48.90 = DSM 106950]|nr:hypothetical protein [Stigonema ocellatum SAG 48.90 = DSM 106950]
MDKISIILCQGHYSNLEQQEQAFTTVNAAGVYHNCSTHFADGLQLVPFVTYFGRSLE